MVCFAPYEKQTYQSVTCAPGFLLQLTRLRLTTSQHARGGFQEILYLHLFRKTHKAIKPNSFLSKQCFEGS
jgi:hypothetical protein